MKTLQFNHSIEGSITIRVEDQNVGHINYSEGKVTAMISYEGTTQNVSYKSLEQARKDIAGYFANLDVYEF
tara:strand:+ start:519 stop:731 length:213 start_codon:yes stop_codon:yes gene_type:complete